MLHNFSELLIQIRQCHECKNLPLGPRPIVQLNSKAKIMIIGQAPGLRAHQSDVAWDDASGKRLRQWFNLTEEQFYDKELVAIMPMGFCYPGRGKSGDLPPSKICAPLWHQQILEQLPNIQLTILIGQYAQNHYLKDRAKTLTETVINWKKHFPTILPTPHPSPRNRIWLSRNTWFEEEVIPELQKRIAEILNDPS